MTDRQFFVVLGPDGAGKSSVMAETSARLPGWRTVSTDDAYLGVEHGLIAELRQNVFRHVLPGLGGAYSVEFLASLLQTAVVYLRDQIDTQGPGPLLMDSYYYKIIAKCRLAGLRESAIFSWWRSFPQPCEVVYLDVSPETTWRRSENGARLNPLEYFGTAPQWLGFENYQRSLRKLMLEEVGQLPVTMIQEQPCVARTADAVLEVLTR